MDSSGGRSTKGTGSEVLSNRGFVKRIDQAEVVLRNFLWGVVMGDGRPVGLARAPLGRRGSPMAPKRQTSAPKLQRVLRGMEGRAKEARSFGSLKLVVLLRSFGDPARGRLSGLMGAGFRARGWLPLGAVWLKGPDRRERRPSGRRSRRSSLGLAWPCPSGQ